MPSRADRYLSWLALVPWPWRSCSSFLARSAQRDTRRLRTATNKHTNLADSVRSAPADDSTTCKASLQRAACNVDATRPEPAAQADGATCVHRSQRSQRPSKHGATRDCGSCSQGTVHTACARICLCLYDTTNLGRHSCSPVCKHGRTSVPSSAPAPQRRRCTMRALAFQTHANVTC